MGTKWGALSWIPPLRQGPYPFGGIPIWENVLGVSFSLNFVGNTGAIWGLFQGHAWPLFLFRLLVIAVLAGYLYRRPKASWGMWLVVVGAIGNVLDYLFYGYVVDFFHFVLWGYSFPIFNVADSYICLGAISLLFSPDRR